VALWTVALDAADRSWLAPLLSDAERARTARIERAAVRSRAELVRGWTRHFLGGWCGIDPRQLSIESDVAGKPCLRSAGDVAFNLSHAGGRLLLAAARAPVGIDLELFRPLPELSGMAALALDGAERMALARLPPAARPDAFLRLWVRKEAVLKGLGTGLTWPPSLVAVGPPEGLARLTALPPGHGPPAAWTLCDLDVPPGWHAALAVRAPVCRPVWQHGWDAT
jgi:4'-phosphopantetheinyl transferase